MIIQRLKPIIMCGLILVVGLAACNTSTAVPNPSTVTSTVATSTPTFTLATPYSQEPAAGICASSPETTVVVTLNPDIPDPRCTKVRSDQMLAVVNGTLNTLRVSIGDFNRSLLPGEEWTINVPFGDYLEVGVHQLSVTPCCSAELWLEGK